jgi:selenocysteine lyase/cysteine desulfurase
VGVFSLTHDTLSPAELAALLEQEHGILTRAGLSCAPRVHQRLGTTAEGGALRMSVGPFVSESDVRRACRALGEVCESTRRRSPVVETANKPAIASSGS